jgi:hypothetical protein
MNPLKSSRTVVIAIFVVAACSKSAPPTASQVAKSGSATAPAAPVIDLRPLTMSFQGKTIARLFADGRTESAGPNAPGTALVPGPTLRADGSIVMTKGGITAPTARIDDKGDIYVVTPPGANPREQLFGRISGDQLTANGADGPVLAAHVEGNLIKFGEDNSSQIDGDVTPSMRHTALVMAAAFIIEGALTTSQDPASPPR